jgi:2',3'-cyclic-nucleotide 3'-phosphodiesterase
VPLQRLSIIHHFQLHLHTKIIYALKMTTTAGIRKASLWLIPPKDSALSKSLATIINQTLPSLFPEALPPNFAPHITLTSDIIPADVANPRQWLDQLQLPDLSGLKITIGELHVGEIVFQKLIQLCDKTEALCELAAACRRAGTGEEEGVVREWIDKNYRPHLSLM